MSKYSPKAQTEIERTMKRFEDGQLKSGSGHKVTNQKQAIAIAVSEARKKNLKVPDEDS